MTITETESNAKQDPGPLTIDHVADFGHRYPGETVTLYTRVHVQQPVSGFTLRITLPAGLVVGGYQAPPGIGDTLPVIGFEDGVRHVVWRATRELQAGTSWEYQVQAQVAPTQQDLTLESQAVATLQVAETEAVSVRETVAISVVARGQYLRYLPALYQEDELMGRFLMLFESFWAPIEGQIDQLPLYVDPKMVPSELLPWFASWFNLVLNERLPEERRRRLIQAAVPLYRKRGTRRGLQEYLAIFTGERPQITEHRANDFRLGPEARLGPAIALGTGNRPHAFTVTLHLPPALPGGDADEQARQESERRRMIEAIIEAEKPAHTVYTLRIETPPTDRQAPTTRRKRKPTRQKGKG